MLLGSIKSPQESQVVNLFHRPSYFRQPVMTRKDLGKVLGIVGGLIAAGEFFVRESRARLNA
jgi:hypothetical protein